jgi:hypothetical protein
VQQFIVDANTLDYPVGSIYYSITSENLDGIDAKAVNEHLLSRNRPQRIRILYTDGPEKAQVTISKGSSLTSTSSTYRAFQKVNTKTASQNTAVACDS